MTQRVRTVLGFGAMIAIAALITGCASAPAESAEPRSQVNPDEFGRNMEACLNEAGYDVKVYDDGSVGISLPDDQMPAFDAASSDCSGRFGYDAVPTLTDEQMSDVYAETVATVECLEKRGYPVPDVPSEQAFIDGTPFIAYGEVPATVVGEEWDKLQRECPQPR